MPPDCPKCGMQYHLCKDDGKPQERGFQIACAEIKADGRFVVYSGGERFPLNANTEAIGLEDLGRMLQAVK